MMARAARKSSSIGIALAVDLFLLVHVGGEAAALLVRVGQLAEGVGELDAAAIELEAFGDAWVARAAAGERGFRDRVFVEDRRAADAENGLDALDHHAAEKVGPGVVGRGAQAGVADGGMERVAVCGTVATDSGEKVDAGVSQKGAGDGQPLRLGEGVGLAAAEGEGFCAGAFGGQRKQRRAVLHQALVGLAGAVPFEHGEFGMVQRPALAVAIDRAEAEDPSFAGCKQLLAGEFRRGVQVERRARGVRQDRLGGEGRQMRLVARRDLEGRCLRPRRNRAGRTSRGSPPLWRCAGAAAAAGRHVGGAPTRARRGHRVSGPCCSVALPPPLPSPR